jgi:Protein of unknown function (DUF2911)
MKYLFFAILFSVFFFADGFAQPLQAIPAIDKSPMDMSTYPANYPLLKIQDKATMPLVARVTYSRPQKNNRIVFGELLEYNTVWRFGANENTEIEFFKDVKINRVLVKKGKYSLFAIPNTDKWTIILNRDLNTWGSFKYDKAKDLLRVDIAVQKVTEIAEAFYIYFDKTTTGFSLNAGWDDVKVTLPINM